MKESNEKLGVGGQKGPNFPWKSAWGKQIYTKHWVSAEGYEALRPLHKSVTPLDPWSDEHICHSFPFIYCTQIGTLWPQIQQLSHAYIKKSDQGQVN